MAFFGLRFDFYGAVNIPVAIWIQRTIQAGTQSNFVQLVVAALKTISTNNLSPFRGILLTFAHPVGIQGTPFEVAFLDISGIPADTIKTPLPDCLPTIKIHDFEAFITYD